jgi:hypothetical protein
MKSTLQLFEDVQGAEEAGKATASGGKART